MRYYLIVGEASGDLHASHLMRSLQAVDPAAEFRFLGGDLMTAVGGTRVKHFKELAYMGFIPVLLHLRTIFRNMAFCKKDIVEWAPDVVILVDYPGFNFNIDKFVKSTTHIPVDYYISPKIWAWKEYRIKNIKRDVDELFSILPFEVNFFERKHRYPIHYVGNPTADEVRGFLSTYNEGFEQFCKANALQADKPILALLAGSRRQEIKDNLPAMMQVAARFPQYQAVLAGAPSIADEYYEGFIRGSQVQLVKNQTYPLLAHATAALVTSGTATLETALFNVPQVVCYKTPVPRLIRFAFNHIIKVEYISLVNLIMNKEVVSELFADRFTVDNISHCLQTLLPGGEARQEMLNNYALLQKVLGNDVAPDNAAKLMYGLLKGVDAK